MRLTDAEARERAARVESLLERLESAEANARALATEALQALVDLYGEALARLVPHVPAATLAGDEVVAHLLLLHDLHPIDLDARLASALQELSPVLAKQGGDATFLGVADGVAKVALRTSGHGCGATALRSTIEDAVRRAAPELERVEIEMVTPPPPLIAADSIRLRPAAGAAART